MKHAKQNGKVKQVQGKAEDLHKSLVRLDRKLLSSSSNGQNNVSQDLSTSRCKGEKPCLKVLSTQPRQ